MIKVKLLPRGKKHQITYRIVIAEDRSKFDGKFIDDLGFYTPQTKTLSLNKEKLVNWQKKGAQLTIGVEKLLNPNKYPNKKKIKKTDNKPAKAKKEETINSNTPESTSTETSQTTE